MYLIWEALCYDFLHILTYLIFTLKEQVFVISIHIWDHTDNAQPKVTDLVHTLLQIPQVHLNLHAMSFRLFEERETIIAEEESEFKFDQQSLKCYYGKC